MTTTQRAETTEATWTKIGRKRYQHISGTVVSYDCNAWMWVIEGTRWGYKTLTVAQYEVERAGVPA